MTLHACAALLVIAAVVVQSQTAGAGTWTAIVADWERFERTEDPFTAGAEGDRQALSRLPDITPAGDARRLAALKSFKARLDALDTGALAPEEAFNRAFLAREVDERIERASFDPARLAFTNEGGQGALLGYYARTTAVSSLADAEAWLARLRGVPQLIRDSIANARRGLASGFTQPASVVNDAIAIAKAEAALTAETDPLLIPFQSMPAAISAADQARLRREAEAISTGDLAAARREWLRFLETEYLPKARPGLGIGSLKEGRPYYAFLAKAFTTTGMTPDEIHEVGNNEVARIRAEMQKEMAAAEFKGSFADFLQWLRTDPKFYAKTRQEMLEKASEIAKRADDGLPKLFRRSLPRLPYGVREVPREIEDQYTTGRYFPGSMANGVAGGYIVNTGKLDQRPLYELPALTVHEAVPGHHLQIAIAQELEDQPWFRRHSMATAFVEGWALYSEYLGVEMGIYRDPFERFGRLSYEMWRACRLVADTGIHWKGWTLEQARACFRDNSALAPHNIETELQRYVADPGQALAYKIGELRMKALREKATKTLGERFDVREFHDTVLLGGALRLDMLEQRIDAWLKEKAGR
ncbi:MAG TPA: DUF885 family protein [Vicinamibacterales bacterium]|nr:DUF885 family protein [Vicinamibacterales bacterium]